MTNEQREEIRQKAREWLKNERTIWERLPGMVDDVVYAMAAFAESLLSEPSTSGAVPPVASPQAAQYTPHAPDCIYWLDNECDCKRAASGSGTPANQRREGHSALRWNKESQTLEKFDPHPCEAAGKSSGFEVKIKFHTDAANETMRSPQWVRERIGTVIDTHNLQEEIDYTLEVRRLYE